MQVYKNDKIIESITGTEKELQEHLGEILKSNATHAVIGKLPSKGDEIKINGLVYEVTYVDKQLGKLFLKIK